VQQEGGGTVRGVIAGVAIALAIVACAAGHTSAVMPVVAHPSAHDQIEQLAAQIASKRDALGISPASAHVRVMGALPPSCTRAETDTCKEMCTLSDDICSDAQKICDLAATLPGDPWAKDKCDSAQATCDDARHRCCECR
jgi:hypothetical protein